MIIINLIWTTPTIYSNRLHVPIDIICCSYSGFALKTANIVRNDHKNIKFIYVFPYLMDMDSLDSKETTFPNLDTKVLILKDNDNKDDKSPLLLFERYILPFIKKLIWTKNINNFKFYSNDFDYKYNVLIVTDNIYLHSQFGALSVDTFVEKNYKFQSFFKDEIIDMSNASWNCLKKGNSYKIFL